LRKNEYQTVTETKLTKKNGEEIRLPTFEVQLRREKTIGKIDKGLFEAVIDVDLDRIRACEICTSIFWAKRFDSETCSPKCFGVLRTRRYRNLTVEEKAKRKADREANKNIKKESKIKGR
jgi:hypothetical protein